MNSIVVANTKSEEVYRILNEKVLPAVEGESLALAAAAMLMVIITSMKPNIDSDELVSAITDTSAFIATRISTTGTVN